jgi:hypothetical protein
MMLTRHRAAARDATRRSPRRPENHRLVYDRRRQSRHRPAAYAVVAFVTSG